MKFFKISTIALAIVLLPMGCSEEFLEVQNVNDLSTSSFYQTPDQAEDLLITCYMPLAFSQLFGNNIHFLNYCFDDRVIHERSNLQNLIFDPTEETSGSIYDGIYVGVNRCNQVINQVPAIEFDDETRKSQVLGEAYFLRGLYYFYAAAYFQVPPLFLENPKDPKQGLKNSTQDEIYDQVESDFKEAIDRLPLQWGEDMKVGRATKGAATGFLGKTYFYRQKWAEAHETFKKVMDMGIYGLIMPENNDSLDYVHAYLANFTHIDMPGTNGASYDSENNKESLFEVQFSTNYSDQQYLPGRRCTGSHMSWYNGLGFTGGFMNIALDNTNFPKEFEKPSAHPAGLDIDPRYYAAYFRKGDPIDFRTYSDDTIPTVQENDLNSSLGTKTGLRKYYYPAHTSEWYANAPFNDPKNFRLMRYADVLLMYAEARLQATGNGTDTEALAAINKVRERVGLPDLTELTKEDIIHERDIELLAEHCRYWDIIRWYQNGWMSLEDVRKIKPFFEEKHQWLPIPFTEINLNKGALKQNPLWE